MKKCRSAFSLMELMVVITIIAVLVALGIPSYIKYLQRANLTEAVTVLGEYKRALGVFWSTQGTLPGEGDTLVSTPADLPYDEIVTDYLPDSIESLQLTESGNGVIITAIIDANIFSSLTENNRQIVLGVQPFNGELFFECGNFATNASGTSALGFTDRSVLPEGCNYNGVADWIADEPPELPTNGGDDDDDDQQGP